MKTPGGELAMLGGRRAFEEDIHVGRPNVPDASRLLDRIRQVLENRWLTNDGPFVREFEAAICDVTGAKHCVAVCNGTLGLELAARATGMSGEVLVPSFTFVATPHSLAWQGIRPVFVDVDVESHTIDVGGLEERITSRTSGIVATHLWGRVCEIEKLEDLARRRGLRLIFDAAHAFGVRRAGVGVGNFGDCEVFSFHATKFINAFEGGAVTTNVDEIATRLRSMRNFGFVGLDAVTQVGTNAKMCEVSAAMGLSCLEEMPALIEANRDRFWAYEQGLQGLPGIRVVKPAMDEESNFQYVVVTIEGEVFGLTRDELARTLWAEGVLARRYFHPGCHRMGAYRSSSAAALTSLPVCELLSSQVLVLPTGPTLRREDVESIVEVVRMAGQRASDLKAVLGERQDAWAAAHSASFAMLDEIPKSLAER